MKKIIVAVLSAVVLAGSLALAAPIFQFNPDAASNLMIKNEVIQIAPDPEYTLMYQHVNRSRMTLIYQGKDVKDIYAFYDAALGKEGWKDAPVMGRENGEVREGLYEGTYAFKEYTLVLSVKLEMNRVRVTFTVKEA